ncbi:hypothetical protein CDCA_CDCA01G0384 [Cyanidium caldarium]|uniref:Protein kinase domain-containing protein n=1 Tax=Cyanidium caldarium TaxID=2771 RepID=A0AAV9IPX9_CYACA|nr:hypothetical protein CDCA_CDCA01G0384 [Cyanidium caldarium]
MGLFGFGKKKREVGKTVAVPPPAEPKYRPAARWDRAGGNAPNASARVGGTVVATATAAKENQRVGMNGASGVNASALAIKGNSAMRQRAGDAPPGRRKSLARRHVPAGVTTAHAENRHQGRHQRSDSSSSVSSASVLSPNPSSSRDRDEQLLRVARLAAKDDESRRRLVERDGLPVLASALVDTQTSATGKSHAAFALAELSVLEEHEAALVRAKAPRALLNTLKQCLAMAPMAMARERDAVPPALTTLVSVVRALRNLAAGTPATVSVLCTDGAAIGLSQVLLLTAPASGGHAAVRGALQDAWVEASAALSNIAQEAPYVPMLVKADTLKAMLSHLNGIGGDEDAAEYVFHIMSVMAEMSLHSGPTHAYLLAAGALPALAAMLEAAASRLAQTGASCGAFSVADTAAEACRALGNLCATPDGRAAAARHKPVLRALCQTVLAYVRRNSAAGSPLPPPFPDACRALANLCIDQGAARVAMQAGADVALLAMLDDADGQGDGHHEGRRALMVLAHGSDEARAELLMHLKQRVELAVKQGRSTAALIELRGTLVQLARQRSGGAVAAAAAAVAHAPSSLKSRGRQVARRFQSTGHTVNTRTLGDHGDRFFTSDTFELGQVLGRGGYGVVYLARNTRTNEVVAIKSFQVMDSPSARGSGSGSNSERPDQRSGQPTIDPRAFKEQRLWKRLRHENIVEYKGSFVGERGDLNLVLEYVDGWSLAEHLAQFNEFDEPLVREITRQVLRGLAYLHRHGITHRDLKPGNVMVNQNGVVKITDFGVSSCVDWQTLGSGHTMVGTPWYIAPEMIEGRHYDQSVDIWSLGCTVLELATGKRPYHELNGMAALFRMVQDRMPPIPPGLSAVCESFLRACWVWQPQQRPSAAALLQHPFVRENAKK